MLLKAVSFTNYVDTLLEDFGFPSVVPTLIEINSGSELVKLKVHSLGECDLSERGRGTEGRGHKYN